MKTLPFTFILLRKLIYLDQKAKQGYLLFINEHPALLEVPDLIFWIAVCTLFNFIIFFMLIYRMQDFMIFEAASDMSYRLPMLLKALLLK